MKSGPLLCRMMLGYSVRLVGISEHQAFKNTKKGPDLPSVFINSSMAKNFNQFYCFQQSKYAHWAKLLRKNQCQHLQNYSKYETKPLLYGCQQNRGNLQKRLWQHVPAQLPQALFSHYLFLSFSFRGSCARGLLIWPSSVTFLFLWIRHKEGSAAAVDHSPLITYRQN